MKLRTTLFVALIALVLSACNFTLARDVTPPPGAVQQAQPTQGPVFPAQTPDMQNGATIYAQECSPCHGSQGLGDGPMSAQLANQNITVPALGSPENANAAKPADWFLTVTLGNMQSFMPPFENKLSEQERWNVVAYTLSLSTNSAQVSQGEQLFKKNCADCPTDFFSDQEKMAALSQADLVKMLAAGGNGLPALGNTFSQDELGAVAAYLRTLTLGAPSLAAEPASPSTATSGTEFPSVAGTPGATQQAENMPAATAGVGPVGGKVVNAGGGSVPSGLTVTLHGFDHDTSTASTGPQEVLTQTTTLRSDGSYRFDDVEIPQGRIFLAEVNYEGVGLQSDITSVTADMTSVDLSPITLYENTTDFYVLQASQMHIFFDAANDGTLQVIEVYTLTNSSDKTVIVTTDGTNIPFIKVPESAQNVGFDISQDSAPIVSADNGFAMPPSEKTYGLILFFNLAYTDSVSINQPIALSIPSALVLVPEGIKLKSDQLDDQGMQNFQGSNFEQFNSAALQPGDSLEFSLSGKPSTAPTSAAAVDNRQTLLIGAGAFGLVLVLAGVWMFLRDRNKPAEEELEVSEEDEFENAEEVMDAIIALDDLHRAQKIPDEAYQTRREELKARLKELT